MTDDIKLDYEGDSYYFDLIPNIFLKADDETCNWAIELAKPIIAKVNEGHEFMDSNKFDKKLHLKSVEISIKSDDRYVRYFIEYENEKDGLVPVKLVSHVKHLISDTGFFEPSLK